MALANLKRDARRHRSDAPDNIFELFPDTGEQPSRALKLVEPERIRFVAQVRAIDANELADRRESIAEKRRANQGIEGTGILQPVTVRRDPDAPQGSAQYICVDGEYRARAAQELERERLQMLDNDAPDVPQTPYLVPIVEMTGSEETILVTQLVANGQRTDATPLEEGRAYKRLLAMGLSVAEISRQVSKGENYVRDRLRMAGAPVDIQRMAEQRPAVVSVARELEKLPTAEARAPFIERAIAGEGVAPILRDLKTTITRRAIEPTVPGAPTPSERRDAIMAELRRINSVIASQRKATREARQQVRSLVVEFGPFADGYKADLRRECDLIRDNVAKLLNDADAGE